MLKLTAKETEAINAITKEALFEIRREEPKELFDDNFSWFNRKLLSELCGFDKHEAAGIMSALDKKDIIRNFDPQEAFGWALTDKGIGIAQELFESEEEVVAEEVVAEEVVAEEVKYSWEEVKTAVNSLENQLLEKVGMEKRKRDYVKDVCKNNLPYAMIQVMAMCFAHEITCGDDIKIIKNGYFQLEKNGYIG